MPVGFSDRWHRKFSSGHLGACGGLRCQPSLLGQSLTFPSPPQGVLGPKFRFLIKDGFPPLRHIQIFVDLLIIHDFASICCPGLQNPHLGITQLFQTNTDTCQDLGHIFECAKRDLFECVITKWVEGSNSKER